MMAVVQQYMAAAEMGVAAAYLMEMGSNGGKITTKEVFQKARSALPYARPNFIGMGAGGKTCSQCGTNRTPQWREGPEGPKTLCNACGVKRVRQMRLLTDGHKRRPPAAAPPPKTAASLAKQSSGSLTSDSNAVVRRRDRSPAFRRPQRKAAAKAASRTAEFATTGDWPDDEADASYPNRSAAQSTFTDPSGSEDSAALNSDSAEEVAWTPTRGPGPAHTSMQPPSPFPVVGHETAAAVNLLSMSIREQDLAVGRAAGIGGASTLAARDLSTTYDQHQAMGSPMTFNSAAFAAMVNASMSGGPGAVKTEEQPQPAAAAEELKDALRRLPHSKQTEMALVKERLENSLREEAAANAAVAAVAKILAIKQAAAIRARAAAASTSRDMQLFMADLDEEFDLSSILKKQRTS